MNNNSSSTRLPIPQYVMTLAHAAALRSEDPYRKVGAAALDADNRVIGTAYNGLYPGFKAQDTFWASREERQKYMLHAEINLCSLFRRGEAKVVACTTMPCTSCMQALCAHGVKTIYYCEPYDKSEAPAIASLYGVELIHGRLDMPRAPGLIFRASAVQPAMERGTPSMAGSKSRPVSVMVPEVMTPAFRPASSKAMFTFAMVQAELLLAAGAIFNTPAFSPLLNRYV